jgi:HEPN domain-containing protein
MGFSRGINRRKLAKAFLLRAKADLKSAKDLLEADDFPDATLHAQQCVEKAIKALLVIENRFVSRHIVSDIFSEVMEELKLEELENVLDYCRELERHWIRHRYPFPEMGDIWNPLEEYKEEDANEAIEKAEFVFERLKALIEERYGLVTE